MKGLILAAGYGTRLYPLTFDRPKALLEVGGKAILTRLCEKIASINECDEIFVVTNAKFFNAVEGWSKQSTSRLKIQVFNDGTTSNENRLGAIGDMNLALKKMKIAEDLLIIAGDNLFEFDINNFYRFAKAKSPHVSVALYDVKDRMLAKQYGIVSIDSTAKITEFIEKPQMPKCTLASTGLYFVPGQKLTKVEEYVNIGITQDALGNLIKWIARQEPVYGYVFTPLEKVHPVRGGNSLTGFTEGWFDIGSIEALKKAEKYYAGTRKE